MSGIIFFGTNKLSDLRQFYVAEIGCKLWLEQADCIILKHGNLLFGFCQREQVQTEGMITFFFETREEVDACYGKFKARALGEPVFNDKYQIYQFFAADPEGRTIEFQYFEHPLAEYFCGDELLVARRSVRRFLPTPISPETMQQLWGLCRFAPTSMNTQSYYFKIIQDLPTLEWLAGTRGQSSAPIDNGLLAVAICSDPSLTKRPEQDGCIAAYHFLLAARHLGLGTCWIAAMNRDDVKERLGIPADHYIATITPLGYPAKRNPRMPERKEADWFLRR